MSNEDEARKEKTLSETAVINGPPKVFARVIHRGLSLPSPHRHSRGENFRRLLPRDDAIWGP